MTSLPSALASLTLSVSLALGSTVALAAPPAKAAPASATESPDTGATEDQKNEAEDLSDQAIDAFSNKNYAGAVALFQQAYDIDPQPNFLFNIGRVYEEAGDLEQAVEFYAKFVKQPGVDLTSRETALDRLKVLRAIVEETKEPKQEPKDEPKDEAVPVKPPPQPIDDSETKRKRKIMRATGFGLLGVGAGAMIGAAIVGSLAQGDIDRAFDRDDANTLGGRQTLLDRAQGKALTADVLYGVGGALLLTGVVLVVVGYTKPKPQRVALTPTFGPQGGGVDLRFRF